MTMEDAHNHTCTHSKTCPFYKEGTSLFSDEAKKYKALYEHAERRRENLYRRLQNVSEAYEADIRGAKYAISQLGSLPRSGYYESRGEIMAALYDLNTSVRAKLNITGERYGAVRIRDDITLPVVDRTLARALVTLYELLDWDDED